MLALGTAAAAMTPHASAKTLDAVGITMRSLGNPYFTAMAKGAAAAAKSINPDVRVTSVSADADIDKQLKQIDDFIGSGVNVIVINPVDASAVLPAITRAQKSGIVVVGANVQISGADAMVGTDNVAAGRLSCQALAKDIGGKGNVVIVNGPQVSAVTDRVKGCQEVLAGSPDITLLASDQDGKASREGAFSLVQDYLTRFPHIDGVFAIRDVQAIGAEEAIKQSGRSGIVLTSVDGSPEVVAAMQAPGAVIKASASQEPYLIGELSVKNAVRIINGDKPAQTDILVAPTLVDSQSAASYIGWTQR